MSGINTASLYLPESVKLLLSACDKGFSESIREIRLREGAPVCFTLSGGNYFISSSGKPTQFPSGKALCGADIESVVKKLCGGSIYSYEDCIAKGYIPCKGGIRAGVAGELGHSSDGKAFVSHISSVCIRIPHDVKGISDGVMRIFEKNGLCGILIYSPPAGGKTTLLRELAARLSSGYACVPPTRVALIDERSEIVCGAELPLCDIYDGYPKANAMEYALRTMSPEIILCDELGAESEVNSVLAVQNAGVPLVATAHAKSKAELLRRPQIKKLIDAGVFEFCYEISSGKACEMWQNTSERS